MLPFPPPGDLPNPQIKPTSPVSPSLQADSLPPASPALQADSLPLSHPRSRSHVYLFPTLVKVFTPWALANASSTAPELSCYPFTSTPQISQSPAFRIGPETWGRLFLWTPIHKDTLDS